MDARRDELAARARAVEDRFVNPPRFPLFINTSFGTGSVGPYAYHEASALLSGEKPVSILHETDPQDLLDILMTAVERGFLTYKEVWQKNSPNFGHTYYFCQLGREKDINELIAMEQRADKQFLYTYPKGNGCYGYTVWDEIRMGEILGYTKADIAAFLEHAGYSSELYLDPSRRKEAEMEQVKMGNSITKKNPPSPSAPSP